jgi:hypothetical protein
MLDREEGSVSRGSFDRTWWCWKFTDFSAPRMQEGIYPLAFCLTSPLANVEMRNSGRLLDGAASAIGFWARLQHADGCFDEAYPFERSLAATAFTGFYVGAALERLRPILDAGTRDTAMKTIERGATWLDRNGEWHGVLSNHLAAAAGALQLAGDILGTDRFKAARDRYIGKILAEQHAKEGWFREYAGADPGYQGHAIFYLAEIWRRTQDGRLREALRLACAFSAWFAHPDGSMGGEHCSRGTTFSFPAGFEILAPQLDDAAAVAGHLRRSMAGEGCVGAAQMDVWNFFPLLNNLLFAAEMSSTSLGDHALPWHRDGARIVYPDAGLAVARSGNSVIAVGLANGVLKHWLADGTLVYEDAGYLVRENAKAAISHDRRQAEAVDLADCLRLRIETGFCWVTSQRFDPMRFICFRLFTTTAGRIPTVARWLKSLLVRLLVSRTRPASGRLVREICFHGDGALTVTDALDSLPAPPVAIADGLPYHMGSSRYCSLLQGIGPTHRPQPPLRQDGHWKRRIVIPAAP